MIFKATVIDQAFIRYEEYPDKALLPKIIISKPSYMENGVYFPPESVTLFGKELLTELHRFVHELVAETNNPKPSPTQEIINAAESPINSEECNQPVPGIPEEL